MSMSRSIKPTLSIFGFEIINDVLANEITMNYSDIVENGPMIVRCEELIATDIL